MKETLQAAIRLGEKYEIRLGNRLTDERLEALQAGERLNSDETFLLRTLAHWIRLGKPYTAPRWCVRGTELEETPEPTIGTPDDREIGRRITALCEQMDGKP